MSDLIRRQNAIDAWDKLSKRGRTEFDQVLMTLPSVEPKTGRWLMRDGVYGATYCSECNYELRINDVNYCPNCGAIMRRKEE